MPQILRDIIRVVLRGERFSMPNGGDHRFHFVHVEDVAQAAIRAADATSARSYVFNVAGGGPYTKPSR